MTDFNCGGPPRMSRNWPCREVGYWTFQKEGSGTCKGTGAEKGLMGSTNSSW